MTDLYDLAGAEYHGVAGSSYDCKEAVERLLHYRNIPEKVRILTTCNIHSLFMDYGENSPVIIKNGFTSGYSGGGSGCFADCLRFFVSFNLDIDEIDIDDDMHERLNISALTQFDTDYIRTTRAIRPSRFWDYFCDINDPKKQTLTLQDFRPLIPLALIEDRLMVSAIQFWYDPDAILYKAFRALEAHIGNRIDSQQVGSKLIATAFNGSNRRLTWEDITESEIQSRANMFSGIFGAYRNPRAHKETKPNEKTMTRDFLLLNELYHLGSGPITLAVFSEQ